MPSSSAAMDVTPGRRMVTTTSAASRAISTDGAGADAGAAGAAAEGVFGAGESAGAAAAAA